MNVKPFELDRIRSSGLIQDLEFHEEIGSTNDRAAELSRQSRLDCPFLVLTNRQTAGRGRGPNRWWSATGALTFTLVLEIELESLPTERWPRIALAAGGAVCEALERAVPEASVRVKWPNDVYLCGKKVGGILVEVPAVRAGRLLVGIGVNVNNSLDGAPEELARIATSICDEAGHTLDLNDVLLSILACFRQWRTELVEDERALFARWRTRCLLTGKRVCLSAGSQQVSGMCHGIDEEGRLVLATLEGPRHYLSGTIVSFD
jgi:BirA family transcriptional regulator, biotin operon repressor / biotin---[acetyl-CoA-carboxylase] ligase